MPKLTVIRKAVRPRTHAKRFNINHVDTERDCKDLFDAVQDVRPSSWGFPFSCGTASGCCSGWRVLFLTRVTFPLTLVKTQMPESRAIVSKHSELHRLLGPRAFDVAITERDEVRFVFFVVNTLCCDGRFMILVPGRRTPLFVWINFLDAEVQVGPLRWRFSTSIECFTLDCFTCNA